MKIATWNVNSIKARLHAVTAWLEAEQPDVACLQEIKTVDEGFPRLEIEALGYHIETHGQKSYNGVALLSKSPLEDVRRGLPGACGVYLSSEWKSCFREPVREPKIYV